MSELDPAQRDRFLNLLAQQSKEHAIVLLDADARVRWWSPGAAHIFGRGADEMLNQPVSILFTPEDVDKGIPQQEIRIALAFGRAEDDRWQLRSDGSRFWATGMLVPLRDENKQLVGFGKILRNRTDLKEQLETLRNQVDALTSSERRKSDFLATVAHELRNPLTPLTTALELITSIVEPKGELEYPLKLIGEQVDFIRRMLDDLADLTRIGTGKIRLNMQSVALQDVIDKAVEATRPLLDERCHRIEVVSPAAKVVLQADPDRLHQVFVNLLTNAAKYTPQNGFVSVRLTVEGKEAAARVEDTGVGIPHDMLSRIFDLFTQVETQVAHGGLGIGLALVKDLVTLHGGSVQVRSEGEGKGSEFTVRLPIKPHERDAG